MTLSQDFDVLIVGASYAGLSAAMSLGRSLRKVLLIDAGSPCNASTPHSHNFLTQDGKSPQEISHVARKELEKYPSISFYQGFALEGRKTLEGFEVLTDRGDRFSASKLIFATGIKDQVPNKDGFAACWGVSLIHCPYCHGYEYRSKRTGILANGDMAFHLVQLVQNLSKDLLVFTEGKASFSTEQQARLEAHNINIIETGIRSIRHEAGYMHTLVLEDNQEIALEALYARFPFEQHSSIPLSLGCAFTEQGLLKIDAMQKTSVEGVFACGDNSNMMRSVANAVATGSFTGAVVNKELVEERF